MSKEGFEPPTLWFVATCSSPLSYMPLYCFLYYILIFFENQIFQFSLWFGPPACRQTGRPAILPFENAFWKCLLKLPGWQATKKLVFFELWFKISKKKIFALFLKNECLATSFWKSEKSDQTFRKNKKINYYADSFEAVFTYKIRRNDVGIMINKAVAVNPKILTSIKYFSWKFWILVFSHYFSKFSWLFKKENQLFDKWMEKTKYFFFLCINFIKNWRFFIFDCCFQYGFSVALSYCFFFLIFVFLKWSINHSS